MRTAIIVFILIFTSLHVIAQTEEEENEEYSTFEQDALDTLEPVRGPNSKTHGYFYLGYGFLLGETEGDGGDIKYGLSSTFNVGFRGKLKIADFYHAGFDVQYHYSSYHLKQNDEKILPYKKQHDKEKLFFNNVNGGLFNRFIFHRKGNEMGKFLDIGAFAGWTYSTKHYTFDKHSIANSSGGSETETITSGLIFTEELAYGFSARLGWNHVVLFGTYRYSNLFKKDYIFPELPRYEVGIEIGFHE